MAARADLAGVTVDGWTVLVKAPAQNRVPFWTATHETCGIVADLPHVSLTRAIAGKTKLPACTTCVPATERPRIDHGMHLACGTAHLIGTACPDGVTREPGPNTPPGVRMPATLQDYPAYERPSTVEVVLDLKGGGDELAQALRAAVRKPAAMGTDPYPTSWPLNELTVSDEDSTSVVELPEGFRDHFNLAPEYVGVLPKSSNYYGHPSENAPLPIMPATAYPAGEWEYEPEPAAILADPTTAGLVIHGRVDRLEAPQDVLDVIRRAMAAQERNHQSEPGPSQFGGCERRLGFHLATGIGNGSTDDGAWRPQVGTAVHAWLDEVFTLEGDGNWNETGQRRWLSSYKVTNPVAGTIDIADLERRVAIDFKITGKATRDKAARGQVSDTYEVQLDLYALGLINDGYAIETVALLLLPASGSLSEAVWYERPVNLDRAREAVARRDRINAMLSVAPIERVLAVLTTQENYCGSCPAFGKYCEGAAIQAAPPALRMVGGAA